MALPSLPAMPAPEREPNDASDTAATHPALEVTPAERTRAEANELNATTRPLDISQFTTAILVSPAVEADLHYQLWLFVNDHEDEAERLHRRANALGPQLAMWEGTLIALGEDEARLAGYSRPGLRDLAQLKRTRAQMDEIRPQADRLHREIVALRSAAKEHQVAAERIRRTLRAETLRRKAGASNDG